MSSLSTVIITLNEAKKLDKCISSVKNISDEIVVVDSGSTDSSVSIAKNHGTKVYYRKFDNYANQKNYALSKASSDWIYSVDADEVTSSKLASEIREAVTMENFAGFTMPRNNYILGGFVGHTRWQPELDRHIWLFRKDRGKWYGQVHEEVRVKGRVGKLKSPKYHYQDETVSDFFKKLDRYSTLEAKDLIKRNIGFSYISLVYEPIYEFLIRYVYRLGFLDGWRGFILSYLMAIYRIEVWTKIWSEKHI